MNVVLMYEIGVFNLIIVFVSMCDQLIFMVIVIEIFIKGLWEYCDMKGFFEQVWKVYVEVLEKNVELYQQCVEILVGNVCRYVE